METIQQEDSRQAGPSASHANASAESPGVGKLEAAESKKYSALRSP